MLGIDQILIAFPSKLTQGRAHCLPNIDHGLSQDSLSCRIRRYILLRTGSQRPLAICASYKDGELCSFWLSHSFIGVPGLRINTRKQLG